MMRNERMIRPSSNNGKIYIYKSDTTAIQ